MKNLRNESHVVMCYGTEDIMKKSLLDHRLHIEFALKKIANEKGRVRVGILKLPVSLHDDDVKSATIRDFNTMIEQCCNRSMYAKTINGTLSKNDLSRNGMSLNTQGRVQAAGAIKKFVRESCRQF